MSFLQTKEVIERLNRCSRKLVDGYEELHEEAGLPDVSVLFRRAMVREQQLIDALQIYVDAAPKSVLGVWFQSPCLHPLRDAVREVEEADISERDDAIKLMCQCEQAWAAVCKHLSDSTMSREVSDLFRHLYDVRVQGRRDMMWQSTREGQAA